MWTRHRAQRYPGTCNRHGSCDQTGDSGRNAAKNGRAWGIFSAGHDFDGGS